MMRLLGPPVKTIYATHTEAVSLLRGFMTGITSIIGGKQDMLNKKMDDVTEALMKRLRIRSILISVLLD